MSLSIYTKSNSLLYVTGLALGGLTFYSFYRRTLRKSIDTSKKSIEPAKPISTLTQDDLYFQKAKHLFLDTFLQEETLNAPRVNYNENIPALFYDISDYKHAVLLDKNFLELSWKQRILIQATPRGNVIMFYDVYKHGFSYYADTSIPYSILNAVAMKYVLLYRCRHFFLDEQIVPIGCTSPFVALYFKEIDAQNTAKHTDHMTTKIDVKKGPFAKFAPKLSTEPLNNYIAVNRREKTGWISWFLGLFRRECGSVSEAKVGPKNVPLVKMNIPVPELVKNRMIYLGKCANFSVLLRPTVDLKRPIAVKQKQISYSNFKSWQNPDVALFS